MDIILRITALSKSFKGQMAVNNVSLEIRRNSVYGLLGPNGAGKSTFLKIVAGLLRPDSGKWWNLTGIDGAAGIYTKLVH